MFTSVGPEAGVQKVQWGITALCQCRQRIFRKWLRGALGLMTLFDPEGGHGLPSSMQNDPAEELQINQDSQTTVQVQSQYLWSLSLVQFFFFSAFRKDLLSALFMHITLFGALRTLDKTEDNACKARVTQLRSSDVQKLQANNFERKWYVQCTQGSSSRGSIIFKKQSMRGIIIPYLFNI